MKRWIATVTLTLAAPVALGAEAAAEDAGKRLIDDFVREIVTLQGDFEQVLLDADEQIVDRTSGTLEIQRPGKFRWSYTDPYEQWLVADGLNIWSYDVDLEQVTVKPQSEALANTPALLLGGSENALDQFDYKGSYVEKDTTWVRLEPKNTESGFVRVELGFLDETLHRMVFFDNLEQTTLVSLYDVSVNEPIDPVRFAFELPEGVDIVGTPVVAEAMDP